jgi:hypothetical protein
MAGSTSEWVALGILILLVLVFALTVMSARIYKWFMGRWG